MVSDHAVMRDMRAHHEQAVISDFGPHQAALGAGIHRDMLAQNVIGADDQFRRLAVIFQVLRLKSDRRKWINMRIGTDSRLAGHHDMGNQPDAVAQGHFSIDTAIGTDLYAGA